VLRLPGGVAGDQDDTADGLAADMSGVILDEAVVADGTDEVELLALIQRADGDQDGRNVAADGIRPDLHCRDEVYGNYTELLVRRRQWGRPWRRPRPPAG
jgi:hypothetical protein